MDIPFIKTESLVKLQKKGRIDKVYERIFDVANRIASKETREYLDKNRIKLFKNKYQKDENGNYYIFNFYEDLFNYHTKRLDHHMDRMYKMVMKEIESRSDKE